MNGPQYALIDLSQLENLFRRVVHEVMADIAPGGAFSRQTECPDARLTRREQQVYELLKERRCNQEIAAKLRIEKSTVKSHVSSVLSKLGYTSRRQAAVD